MINRLPAWFKQEIPDKSTFEKFDFIRQAKLNSVCKSAHCPNIGHCFKSKKITFMILGDICTRDCRFCAMAKNKKSFLPVDKEEPSRIAILVKKWGLNYVVLTSVTRDDLSDGGASIFARTIELIRRFNKNIKIEVLLPDFQGKISSLKTVVNAEPDVVSHNLETVRCLYKGLRMDASYDLSLALLANAKIIKPGLITKSSLMLGFGETKKEVKGAMVDLRNVNCDILTLGQYLAPSEKHYQVKEFITPERFAAYQDMGVSLGFRAVLSGPKVRSSYDAEELYSKLR